MAAEKCNSPGIKVGTGHTLNMLNVKAALSGSFAEITINDYYNDQRKHEAFITQ